MKAEERREAKVEKLQARASKLESLSDQTYLDARKSASCIPFGQPIHVGHYSEKGDRRFRARIDDKMRKSVLLSKEAEELKTRAESVAKSNAIMSTDDDAEELIKEKIARLKKGIEEMKAETSFIRKLRCDKRADAIEKLSQIEKNEREEGNKVKADWILEIIKKVEMQNHWYHSDKLFRINDTTSGNREIKRLEERLEMIRIHKKQAGKEFEINGVKVSFNETHVVVEFPGIPSEEVRKQLKTYPLSLKWSPRLKAWVRKYGPGVGRRFKDELVRLLEAIK